MDAGPTFKPKVTVKLAYKPSTTFRQPLDANVHSRPASPTKNHLYTNQNDSTATFRPKAKVNSSATTRKAAVTSANSVHGSTGPPPRSESPMMKTIPRVRSTLSPKTATSGGASTTSVSRTARVPAAAVSAPVTPESRRVLPQSSALASSYQDHEGGSVVSSLTSHHSTASSSFTSLQHAASSSSTVSSSLAPQSELSVPHPRLTSSRSVVNLGPDRRQAGSPTLRIRSKVTHIAKAPSTESAPATPALSQYSSSYNLYPSTRTFTPRPRAPSSSSNVSQQQPTSPPTQFYPITTAVSAANPHRYPSARPPPVARATPSSFSSFGSPNGTPSPQPPAASSQSPSTRPARVVINGGAKVDPALIPLPLNSPPASTVSFSSRSSASNSHLGVSHSRNGSVSTDTGGRPSPTAPPVDLHATLDNLMKYTSEMHSEDETTSGGDDGDDTRTTEELKVKATAKSNRKIADLEITNRSLMAINTSLEATKHRQAKEIRELRRKLRETRLILPPRTYAEIKSSSDGLADEEVSEDDEDEENSDVDDTAGDEIYKRIKIIMENLLKSGEEALRADTSADVDGARNTTKVLTAAEVNDYHNNGSGSNGERDDQDDNESVGNSLRSRSPNEAHSDDEDSNLADEDADQHLSPGDKSQKLAATSEDEVEAMVQDSGPGRRSSSATPPIFITKPTS